MAKNNTPPEDNAPEDEVLYLRVGPDGELQTDTWQEAALLIGGFLLIAFLKR